MARRRLKRRRRRGQDLEEDIQSLSEARRYRNAINESKREKWRELIRSVDDDPW